MCFFNICNVKHPFSNTILGRLVARSFSKLYAIGQIDEIFAGGEQYGTIVDLSVTMVGAE